MDHCLRVLKAASTDTEKMAGLMLVGNDDCSVFGKKKKNDCNDNVLLRLQKRSSPTKLTKKGGEGFLNQSASLFSTGSSQQVSNLE